MTRPSPATTVTPPQAVPYPAPSWRRVTAQALFEAGTLLRNGEQLLLSVVLPVIALVALVHAPFPAVAGERIDVFMPGALALSVASTAFTGQAISTAFDRRYGVLRLLGTTPLGAGGLLWGKVGAVLVVEAVQFATLSLVGVALGWRPPPSHLVAMIVPLIVGTVMFTALAMALASRVRPEAMLALANLVWVLMGAVGGLVIPPSGSVLAQWIALSPSGAFGEAVRSAAVGGAPSPVALLVLCAWAALFAAAAARLFRWQD